MAEAGPSSSSGSGVTVATTAYPDPAERLAAAEEYKNCGNDAYKNNNFRGAIGKYHRALLQLKDMDLATKRKDMRSAFGLSPEMDDGVKEPPPSLPKELLHKASDLETTCLNNLAACLLQQPEPNYSKVVHYCSQVLERNRRNGKALYRRGVGFYHLHNYEGAQQSLVAALEITPGDPNVRRYLELCNAAVIKQTDDEKRRYRGMFDKMAAQGDR